MNKPKTATKVTLRILEKLGDVFEKYPIKIFMVLFLLGCSLLIWQVSRLSSSLISYISLQNVAFYADIISEVRTIYTSEVVEKLRPKGIVVTHDYKGVEGAIPLPATLTLLLGERIGQKNYGMDVRLYSEYPFPWRKNGGPRDKFEIEALHALSSNPQHPYYQDEVSDGRKMMRYAVSDIMRKSCVECHNSHPMSPKKDWKEGDVRGVLAIKYPLEKVKERTGEGLKNIIALMLIIFSFFLAGLILSLGRLSRTAHMLKKRSQELENSLQEAQKKSEIERALRESEKSRREITESFEHAKKLNEELTVKTTQLEGANRLMIERELKMIELKKENQMLKQKLGELGR